MSLTTRTALPLSSALLTLILGALQALMPLSIDLYLPGLPTIARDLNVTSGAAQATLAVFMLGVALGQIVYGPVTDKYGRKPPLLLGLAVYVLSSVLCALAPSMTVLLAGRFLQALGASAAAVITATIVRDLWSGKALADRLSILMLIMGAAPILAPSLGGLLLTQIGWHGLFWLLAIFGVLITIIVTRLPETSSAQERAQTRLRDAATNYLSLLRNTPFLLYILTGACTAGMLFAYLTGSSFMYIDTLDVTPGVFAVLFGVNAAGLIIASQINRVLLRHFSLFAIARSAILAAVVLAGLLLAVVLSGAASVPTLTLLLFLLLATFGFIFPNIAALAFSNVKERMGSAAALQGTLQSTVGGLAGALVGVLAGSALLPVAGIITAFAVLATIFLLAAHRARPTA
ncbi:multidrug effflux MFS transporter [Deinococcus peraridilitoris]|uniref:Drug resistance transporter, Bcr/CflA subfamily n=1 Tax=Deinococcus peraridilitoris (strain DSM 19664 / LMG 22246 / CIP 109416 / KR-200) TaxID=937777 RepID=L0A6V2_DEIPD|nr:multidrug effflux MFS transporter [Deinococcus peraridilitoris]AFZ69588.1 drug resistance transporter, Bcr/CflA subfamily [Deinococcus peraridilitoris DSM 19664]